jgi:hypothetical protein
VKCDLAVQVHLVFLKRTCCVLNELAVPNKHYFQGGEFEDKEPDAFDLFKLCHFSKKKGYKPNVRLAIVSLLPYDVLCICLDSFNG